MACPLAGYSLPIQVAELASLAQLLPPCSPTVRNPVPDSSLCRAAAPRLRRLQLLLPDCVGFSCCSPRDCLDLLQFLLSSRLALQLLLAACVHFSCCSRLRPFQLLPDCIRFGCCSPIASASNLVSASARFVCCSPIASVSTAAPRLCPFQLLPDCVPFGCSAAAPRQLFWKIPAMSNTLR